MHRLSIFFMDAASRGTVTTLNQLAECREFADLRGDPLAVLQMFMEEAAEHQISVEPDPRSVDWNDPIALRKSAPFEPAQVGREIGNLIAENELPNVELKSTLWTNLRRKQHDPNATAADLKSPDVANSSMKTICGFLNKEGGDLIIGVGPELEILGIDADYEVVCPKEPSPDGWLLALRETINSFFYEPAQVQLHLNVEVGEIDGKYCCKIHVGPRDKMSLCKCKNMSEYKIYNRNGTSTDCIGIEHVEDFIAQRARLISGRRNI
jgi:hypothetical protein